MKTRHKRWLGIVALGALGALAGIWWLARPAVIYDTAVIVRGDVESSVSAVGKLQPRRFVDVGAQVSGQILRLHVQAGDVVKKGTLLVEIDPSVQKAVVDAGRASLTGLHAQLAEQKAQHLLTRQQALRQERLDAGGATRGEDLDIARANLAQAAARVEHLQAQIVQTSATVQADEVRLGYTRIYATMDGTVVSVDAREGQTLNATYQTPGILRIADLGTMTVWTEVSEAEVRKVHAGMPVYFTTLGSDRRRWHGKVRQVLPAPPSPEGKSMDSALAPSSSKVIVYTALFDVENGDGELMPQMTAQVNFVAAAAHHVVLAPLAALRPASGNATWTARVVEADGRPRTRQVRIGVRSRVSAEIIEGLAEGERIVTGEQPQGGVKRFQL
jgi:macrolide-specific efflux system membrane fusion protein